MSVFSTSSFDLSSLLPINNATGVLNLGWTVGFNRSCEGIVHSLADSRQKVLFYTAGHIGVLYDWIGGRQKLLLGHTNQITTSFVGRERRWVGTADSGPNSMIIIWDTRPSLGRVGDLPGTYTLNDGALHAVPIKTIYAPHGGHGVVAGEFTSDSKHLVTLGKDPTQTLLIWDWTTNSNEPICQINISGEPQKCIRINPIQPTEFVSNGDLSVNFFVWDKQQTIKQIVPILSSKDFKHTPSGFTCSAFLPAAGEAITATKDGEVIVWVDHSLSNLTTRLEAGQKAAIKFVKLNNGAINFITCINDQYILTGSEDGVIKVFDMNFRIVFWHEKIHAGPIAYVSHSPLLSEHMFDDTPIPELVVATKHSQIILLHKPTSQSLARPSSGASNAASLSIGGLPISTILVNGQYGNVTSLVTHPSENHFAVGSDAGLLQIWDISSKQVIISRLFTEPVPQEASKKVEHDKEGKKIIPTIPMKIECLSYSATGKTLAVGFSTGVLRILDVTKLEDLPQTYLIRNELPGHQISQFPLKKIAFSSDGDYCAVADGDHAVCILRKEEVRVKTQSASSSGKRSAMMNASNYKQLIEGNEGIVEEPIRSARKRMEWVLIGRAKTHYKDIISFIFVPPSDQNRFPLLYSISKDRHVVDYNLADSTVSGGLSINSIRRIEQIYRPESAVLLTKPHAVHPERLILTFNSGFKFRTYTASNQLCRSTSLGPTFGGTINNLITIPDQMETRYVAYSTSNQVVGIVKLPLDGNPFKTMGVIGHPSQVSSLAATFNGTHLISAGSKDGIVNVWNLNPAALEAQIQVGGEGLEPYLNMLDPNGLGQESPVYREFEDYFYYAQLRSQGEDCDKERMTSNTIPLSEVPAIMQAMGYYMSNQEMDDMINEVKYSRFVAGQGEEVGRISFSDIIKLYLNHKPVQDVSVHDIELSLSHARRLEPGKPIPTGPILKMGPTHAVKQTGLISLLQQYGESMSADEVHEAFSYLLEDNPKYEGRLPGQFKASEFISDLLGFQTSS